MSTKHDDVGIGEMRKNLPQPVGCCGMILSCVFSEIAICRVVVFLLMMQHVCWTVGLESFMKGPR